LTTASSLTDRIIHQAENPRDIYPNVAQHLIANALSGTRVVLQSALVTMMSLLFLYTIIVTDKWLTPDERWRRHVLTSLRS
jgi:hypothetical protein